ncbi:hypothetical protein N7522_002877 [Penicillium canescens]|nr:hypothetical protein N7522_002877 [Penicillium canescens]
MESPLPTIPQLPNSQLPTPNSQLTSSEDSDILITIHTGIRGKEYLISDDLTYLHAAASTKPIISQRCPSAAISSPSYRNLLAPPYTNNESRSHPTSEMTQTYRRDGEVNRLFLDNILPPLGLPEGISPAVQSAQHNLL